jgi:hypothetical protein
VPVLWRRLDEGLAPLGGHHCGGHLGSVKVGKARVNAHGQVALVIGSTELVAAFEVMS